MQGLADGYFILPYTIGDYLAGTKLEKLDGNHAAVREAEAAGGGAHATSPWKFEESERSLHSIVNSASCMWDDCGMARTEAGLKKALKRIPELREEFWKNVNVLGGGEELNQSLENAGRVADFLEFGELMCLDALQRNESCGGHFREEFQTPDGEALRDDSNYSYVAAWEYARRKRASHPE